MSIEAKNLKWFVGIVLIMAASSAMATPSTAYYIYDESGHVIGEYDATGNPIQEHVYLGDRPVAVAVPVTTNGTTTTAIDYVTTDQINTPRLITDSGQNVVWSWNSDPFGNGQPTGSLTYNLRFPGQYYDAETGHNYNYFRDYDTITGRYIESDPVGLKGGINTYSYVNANPLQKKDPLGLVPPYFAPLPPGVTDQDVQQSSNMQNAYNQSQVWQGLQPNGPTQCGTNCEQIAQATETLIEVPLYASTVESGAAVVTDFSAETLAHFGADVSLEATVSFEKSLLDGLVSKEQEPFQEPAASVCK